MKRVIFKIIILISTVYAVIRMLHWPVGFTMFTQLSNLFVALVVLRQLLSPEDPRLPALKFAATVSILVTFTVYLTVLGPMMPGGLIAAYAQDHCASLCFHVITPLACLADFLINDAPSRRWTRRHALIALVPPLLWFCMILMLGALGFRWHGAIAPYPFLNYIAPAGWFGFMPDTAGIDTLGIGVAYAVLAMVALFLLISLALLALAGRAWEKKR